MYAIKIPSYTKMYKLQGHLFQVYNVTSVVKSPNGTRTQSITCDSYIDYNKKQKVIEKYETFIGNIQKNPDPKKISIHPWGGSSKVVYFDKLADALVYKALANQQVKSIVFDGLEKIKVSVEKQVNKINITHVDLINKYPELFL